MDSIRLVLMCIAIGLAYRGKGGLFDEKNVTNKGKNNQSHLLGALIAGLGICVGTLTPLWLPVYVALWFIWTKPSPAFLLDLCWGFTWTRMLRSFTRAALIIPVGVAVWYASHVSLVNLLWLAMFVIIGPLYLLGGILQKRGKVSDPVEFAEAAVGIMGIMFYGLANGV